MKKRTITLALAFVMAFSLAAPAGAVALSGESRVEKDMEAMSDAHFNVDAINLSSTNDDGTNTYAYQITEDIIDYVTVIWKDNGSADLDIWEDDFHNVITVMEDGTLLYDGVKPEVEVTVEYTDDMKIFQGSGLSRAGFTEYRYSTLPPIGTPSSYTVGPSRSQCSNIVLASKVRETAASAIGSFLAEYFFPGNKKAKDVASDLFGRFGASLRSLAEQRADDTNKLSYKSEMYGHPSSNTFDTYLRYYNKFYIGANFVDKNPKIEVFYEHKLA